MREVLTCSVIGAKVARNASQAGSACSFWNHASRAASELKEVMKLCVAGSLPSIVCTINETLPVSSLPAGELMSFSVAA